MTVPLKFFYREPDLTAGFELPIFGNNKEPAIMAHGVLFFQGELFSNFPLGVKKAHPPLSLQRRIRHNNNRVAFEHGMGAVGSGQKPLDIKSSGRCLLGRPQEESSSLQVINLFRQRQVDVYLAYLAIGKGFATSSPSSARMM